MPTAPDESTIFALERPHSSLWTYYIIRALFTGPLAIVLLPYFYFRYHTLRYRFDAEGIHMKVGILFRQEVNLTYARIQDIHLSSGFVQRWLGLADIQIQTASGNMNAELTIEGFKEYKAIRDFLYSRMRGTREPARPPIAATPQFAAAPASDDQTIGLLLSIRDELRATREALAKAGESSAPKS